MWKPIQTLWNKIEGNLYFWIIGAIFSAIGSSAVLTSIWKRIQSYRGVHATDSTGLFVLCLLVSCLLLLAWIAARREVKLRGTSFGKSSFLNQTESITGVALPEPTTPLSVDLRGEILELYFQRAPYPLPFSPIHILLKVLIVNHGPDQATITHCGLQISLGSFNRARRN